METFEKKIVELHDRVQKEFPAGCDGIICEDCPLNTKTGIVKQTVCEMMWRICKGYNED